MVNLKLAYEELQSTTKKPFKEVKREVDRIYRSRPNISYINLILCASENLKDDPVENVKEKSNSIINNMSGWNRKW